VNINILVSRVRTLQNEEKRIGIFSEPAVTILVTFQESVNTESLKLQCIRIAFRKVTVHPAVEKLNISSFETA
jgi:hypothetical protein